MESEVTHTHYFFLYHVQCVPSRVQLTQMNQVGGGMIPSPLLILFGTSVSVVIVLAVLNMTRRETADEHPPPAPPRKNHDDDQPRGQEQEKEKNEEDKLHADPTLARLAFLLREIESTDKIAPSPVEDETCRRRWEALVAMGDIYARGSYPRLLPDEDAALQCYREAAACPCDTTSGMAQTRYIECRMLPVAPEDRAGADIPTEFARRACASIRALNASVPAWAYQRSKAKKVEQEEEKPLPRLQEVGGVIEYEEDDGGWQHLDADADTDANVMDRLLRLPPTPAPPALYTTDAQNVHDHGVASATRENLRRLREEAEAGGKSNDDGDSDWRRLLAQVRSRMHGGLTAPEFRKAETVLESMRHSPAERQALADVWRKLNTSAHSADLAQTLGKQLASAHEYGSVVCPSGKIARVVSALDGAGFEDLEQARPMWAVREEIGSLAAKIARDAGDGKTGREEFDRRVRDEYVRELGMSPGLVEPIIAEYGAGFDDE